MKNQKGVTLIALVITIIVLLILAAAAIATLTGDNGIFSNAQKARAENTKADFKEKVLIAYNSVKTEVTAKAVTKGEYHSNQNVNEYKLANMIYRDITGNAGEFTDSTTAQTKTNGKYTFDYTPSGLTEAKSDSTKKGTIKITYTDDVFKLGGKISALDQWTAPMVATITIIDNECGLKLTCTGFVDTQNKTASPTVDQLTYGVNE